MTLSEGLSSSTLVSRVKKRDRIAELLEMVELPGDFVDRYQMELSGGQNQRVNLTRHLAAKPEILLCDEVTSALDSIVGDNVIKLLIKLRDKTGISIVFITHDLSTVASFSDRIVVLYAGRVVEQGKTDQVLHPPYHHPDEGHVIACHRELEHLTENEESRR